MDFSINSYATASPSSSYSNSSNSSTYPEQKPAAGKPPGYHSALHSVRKLPGKNVIMKKPIAPMPPTPPKIYKVNPVDFRDVVQRLTGALEFQPTRLREVAPPPLSLSTPHRPRAVLPSGGGFEAPEEMLRKSFDGGNCGSISPLGFSLSPSSMAWCSSILMSPGTLSS